MPRAKVPPEVTVLVEVGSQRPGEVAFDPFLPFEMLWVVTNGKTRRQLLWVCARQTGVYVALGGPSLRGRGSIHASYHSDGMFHWKIAREKVHQEQRLPFAQIQEPVLIQSATVAISDEALTRFSLTEFRDRRVNRLVYLDNRGVEAVHYQIWLVPPFKHAKVPLMTDSPADIHLITATVPWIEVVIYEQGRRPREQRSVGRNRRMGSNGR